MPKVRDVCHVVRSKVAGPFWVTMDLMFDSKENFDRYAECSELGKGVISKVYGVAEDDVKLFPVESLNVLKISFARPHVQGGVGERDLHSGQQYTYILDQELA